MDHSKKTEFFICQCDDLEHQFVLELYDWQEEGISDLSPEDQINLNLSIHLSDWPNVWHRIWNSIKYVFGKKSKYGHFDVITVKHEDVDRLMGVLTEYKEKIDVLKKAKLKLP